MFCTRLFVYLQKNMEKLDRYPFEIKDKVFKKLIETCEVSSWTREERIKYDHALKQFRDTLAVMEGQKQEGREQGIEQGRAEEKLTIARNMKEKDMDANLIAEVTGLSLEEIAEL